jgi:membrane-bound serine protease (ClpP class)
MKSGHLAHPVGRLAVLLILCGSCLAQAPRVLQADLDHVIHPLTVDIVSHALQQAEREGAAAVVLRLNTPGGLLSATQEVIQKIIASPVPVITYVAPSGGRAASAGFMILMAGDVAAMAPGTNTGAAHPVVLGGQPLDPIMNRKVEQDAAAAVRAVTDKRGRNSELAEQAVIESKAFTEEEALENNLIDAVANDLSSLLQQLDGKTITRFDGKEQVIRLAGAVPYSYELTYRERVLLPLVDPSLAFILLILGLIGIYIEFTHPGLIFPGVAGGIVVIVALMALSLLPINWAGVALIVLGLVCFVLEATVTSGGILGVGGSVAMILGAVILIDTDVPQLSIGWPTAVAVTLPFALITIFLLRLAINAFQYKVATGRESMIGEVGVAKTDIDGEGRVFVHGEWWNAQSKVKIASGSKVRVVDVDGLTLSVDPLRPVEASGVRNP